MSNRKRFLAMMLTIAMVLSTFATMAMPAGAATFANLAEEDLSEILDILYGLDIVRGVEPGVFGGEQYVNRQQFALFVARVITGTPGFFEHDTEALERVQRTFGDIRDATFATAIEFAYRAGIIQGRQAPVYENGVLVTPGLFDPTGEVTLQEAVAMMLRALGYTPANAQFLAYPTGYLAMATRPTVKLLGSHVDTQGLDLLAAGATPTQRLRRYDMARLVYNMTLSYRFERLLVPGGAGVLQNVEVLTPVLENFGVERVIGYVTGVRNYAATLNIAHEDGFIERLEGTPVLERTTWGDIEIQYLSTERNLLNQITRHTSGRIRTTMDTIGLRTDYEPVELLGRKVAVFRHINRADTGTLPNAMILGARHDVTDYANEVDITDFRGNAGTGAVADIVPAVAGVIDNVRELELGVGNGEIRMFNQRGALAGRDLSIVTNFYRLGNDGILWAPSVGDVALAATARPETLGEAATAAAREAREAAQVEWGYATRARNTALNSLNALGRLIAGHGDTDVRNYRLYFIDNGIGLDGNPQFFYIFQPMQPVFRHTDESGGRIRLDPPDGGTPTAGTGTLLTNADNYANRRPFHADTNRTGYRFIGDITPTVGNAYMVTISGAERRDVTVYRQLDVLRTESTLIGRTDTQMRFGGTAANNQFTFGRATGDMAMGAFTTGAGDLGAMFVVFGDADTNTPYFARQIVGAPGVYNEFTNYAVIVRQPMALVVGARTVFSVRVFDATIGAERTIRIADLDDRGTPFNLGDIIAMRSRGDIWEAVVINRETTGNVGTVATEGRAAVAGVDPARYTRRFVASMLATATNATGLWTGATFADTGTNDLFNTTRTRLEMAGGDTYTLTPAAPSTIPVAINANTRFVAVSAADNNMVTAQGASGPMGAVAVGDMLRLSGAARNVNANVLGIVTVARGTAAAAGAADVVFVLTNATILGDTHVAPRIGIVLPTTRAWTDAGLRDQEGFDALGVIHHVRYVYEYATNQIIPVATTNSDLARWGNVVRITEDTAPSLPAFPGETFLMIESSGTGTVLTGQTGLLALTATPGATAITDLLARVDGTPATLPAGINGTTTVRGPLGTYNAGGTIVAGGELSQLTPGSRINVLFIAPHSGNTNGRIGHRLMTISNGQADRLRDADARAVVTRDYAGNALSVTLVVRLTGPAHLRDGDHNLGTGDIHWPAGAPNWQGPTIQPTTAVTIAGPGTVAENATITLTATVTPEGAGAVTWTSSNPTVATVAAGTAANTGIVTGVAEGTATITATSDGISATHQVTVTGALGTLIAHVNTLVSARLSDVLDTFVGTEWAAVLARAANARYTHFIGAVDPHLYALNIAITAANAAIRDQNVAALLAARTALDTATPNSDAYSFADARTAIPPMPTGFTVLQNNSPVTTVSITMDGSNDTATLELGTTTPDVAGFPGGSTLTAASSDSTVATVAVDHTDAITVTAVSVGTTTITITVSGLTATVAVAVASSDDDD